MYVQGRDGWVKYSQVVKFCSVSFNYTSVGIAPEAFGSRCHVCVSIFLRCFYVMAEKSAEVQKYNTIISHSNFNLA